MIDETFPPGRGHRGATPMIHHQALVDASRTRLLRAIGRPDDLTLIRPRGNLGDRLILAGTRQLLSAVTCPRYREIDVARVKEVEGDTALIGGSGGWCGPFHGLPAQLPLVEERFARVIVLPSSFDTGVDVVARALEGSRATFFAREQVSFEQIRPLCAAELAHDCAFFFDYSPYRRDGEGVLLAFRADEESALQAVPRGNVDISAACSDLDEWLWTIARHDLVRTDRAHVTIAGALLGKLVEYLPSCYHKVPAIVAWSLRAFPVEPLPATLLDTGPDAGGSLTDAERGRRLRRLVATLVPAGHTFVLVDDAKLGEFGDDARRCLPFLERDGVWWGRPPDDRTAIAELERLRRRGAGSIVFAWPAFWWLEHYAGLRAHLEQIGVRTLEDGVAVAFDWQRSGVPGAEAEAR